MSQRTAPPRCRERVQCPRFQPQAFRGAAQSLLIISTLFLISVFLLPVPVSGFGVLVNLVTVAFFWGASLLLGSLLGDIVGRMARIPERPRWLLLASVFIMAILLQQTVPLTTNVLTITGVLVVIPTLFGFGLTSLRITSRTANPRGWRWAVLFTVVGGLGLATMGAWLLWPGPAYLPGGMSAPHAIPLPSAPHETGPYTVREWSYASAANRHLAEKDSDAGITQPVDLSGLVQGWSGVRGWLRTWYWGFDATEVPLNGKVWYPEGEGPFPLVIMAHGNHRMDGQSHLGYGYLAEHLASRGFIIASIDHNPLNGAGGYEVVLGGLQDDNNGRAYLFLKHLELWHEWNRDVNSPWHARVDTTRIALIGHSRGGEAAATASAMNSLTAHPADATVPLGFNFDIRAVLAVAPPDGQYMLRGEPTILRDVDYLVLQGGADGDVRSFWGSRQFDRIEYSGDSRHIASAVYVHGANHGQFNRLWGRVDLNFLLGFINRGSIMDREEQERVARVFITSFLEASLRDQDIFERVFSTPTMANRWLPEVAYVSQFATSDLAVLAGFQEDADPFTGTVPGSRVSAEGLTEWQERRSTLGSQGSRDRAALHLAWEQSQTIDAQWSLAVPSPIEVDPEDALLISVANRSAEMSGVTFTIRLRDSQGRHAEVDLQSISPLPAPFAYRMLKPPLRVAFEWEPVFSTYSIPLSQFQGENASTSLSEILQIQLVFDRSPAGRIAIHKLALFRSGGRMEPTLWRETVVPSHCEVD